MTKIKSTWFFVGISSIFLLCNCNSAITEKSSKTVYIQNSPNGYQLIRNGKPFLIKGAGGDSFSPELRAAGANTVRIYDTLNLKSKLDALDSLGLAAVIDIHLPKYFGNNGLVYRTPEHRDTLKRVIEKFIVRYKDHPAVLFWILGNEVYEPELFANDFTDVFNSLVEIIHKIDPNHPVTTTVSSSGLSKVMGMLLKSPDLDFISINNFGALNDFEYDKKILFFWQKPYLISEWGIHGPWEVNQTDWAAPLELSSTAKAEKYRESYLNYIKPIDDGRILGSLVFFWGQKQERTHTWFSAFTRDGAKTQVVFEMERIWKEKPEKFNGAGITSLTLNGKVANQNIILNGGNEVKANLQFQSPLNNFTPQIHWEIKPENWNIFPNQIEKEPATLAQFITNDGTGELIFKAPKGEGPYRLFVEFSDQNNYVSTANIPFYVIPQK